MIQLALLVHLIAALLTVFYTLNVIAQTRLQKFNAAVKNIIRMWQTTIATIFTGVLLSIISKSSISSTCVTLLSIVGVVSAAHLYEKRIYKKTGCPYLDGLDK